MLNPDQTRGVARVEWWSAQASCNVNISRSSGGQIEVLLELTHAEGERQGTRARRVR